MQLYKIKMLSQASCRFYRNAMHQVETHDIRLIFQQRFDIYQQLLNLLAQVTEPDDASEAPQLTHTIRWFETAQTSINSFDNAIFLDFLDTHENVAVKAINNAIATSSDQATNAQLAKFVAALQVNHHALHTLQETYKSHNITLR